MLPKLPFVVLLALPVCATPLVTIQLESFTSSVSSSVGSQTCTDPFTCWSTDGILSGTNASASVSGGPGDPGISVSAIWGGQDQAYANAGASVTVVEQVTITGGSGTGIAVGCAVAYGQAMEEFQGGAFLNIGIGSSGAPESAYNGAGCSHVYITGGPNGGFGQSGYGVTEGAADFTYGVPFDLTAVITASVNAIGGRAPCAGCDSWGQADIASQFEVQVVDPPDPPATVPEPSTIPGLILAGFMFRKMTLRNR